MPAKRKSKESVMPRPATSPDSEPETAPEVVPDATTAATTAETTGTEDGGDHAGDEEHVPLNRAERRARGKGGAQAQPTSRGKVVGGKGPASSNRMWANRRSG
jgi:hypothetical protein